MGALPAGLLSYLFLGRALTNLRWCALLLVTVGATTSQLGGDSGGGRGGAGLTGSLSTLWPGYALGLADACCSATGAVYTVGATRV